MQEAAGSGPVAPAKKLELESQNHVVDEQGIDEGFRDSGNHRDSVVVLDASPGWKAIYPTGS